MNKEEKLDKSFLKLKNKILEDKGFDIDKYKENYLKRRIAVRMRFLQVRTYDEYIEVLDKNPDEYNKLLDKLTINVTQFFRDPEVYVYFENEILPYLFSNNIKNIKVWSAGCSTGEEPYSIAISIEEAKEKFSFRNVSYTIYATDLDENALKKAYSGIYEEKTMENIANLRKRKYFTFLDGKYKILDNVKKNVKFIKHNLMTEFKENFFDMIFCRNVIIYFTKELQRNVLDIFYKGLKKEGILVLGKTETMLIDYRDKFKCINVRERIFKKLGE